MSKTPKVVSARLDDDQLTLRESLFVRHYLVSGQGKDAALKAGYRDPTRRASLLLREPRIAKVISRERKRKLSELDATVDKVLRHVVYCAFADPRKFFTPDGNSLRPVPQLDEATAAAIASLDFRRTAKKGLVSRLRFWNKLGALQLLGEYLSLWQGKGDHQDEGRLDEIVAAIQNSPAARSNKEKRT